MNIAIDARCLLEKNYSGVSWYAYNLLLNLFKIDKNNRYFLFYNKYNSNTELIISEFKQLEKFKNYNSVEFVGYSFSNKILNFSLRFLKFPKLDTMIEKRINKKIDVWFSPNPGFLNLSKKCKFILTIHDLSFERYPEFFAGKGNLGLDYIRGRFWHKYVNVKKLCKRADKIIAVSNSTKNDLIDIYNIKSDKIKVVYEGGVICRKSDEADLLLVKDKYSLPDKYILFLGTLEPRKNIESIIKAFEQVDLSYKLVIAGKKGWLYDDLFKLAKESKVSDKINFIGYVNEDDKFALYKMASLFVFPAFYEGFGLPPLEAMSCGCPVVASNTSSIPEVVGEAGMLVDPYNINEIAQAMKFVLSDHKLKEGLIKKGLERSNFFEWRKVAIDFLKESECFID